MGALFEFMTNPLVVTLAVVLASVAVTLMAVELAHFLNITKGGRYDY